MTLFEDRDIKKWMRSSPPSFDEWLEQEFTDYVHRLMSAEDSVSVGRFQGRLELLETLRDLRKDASNANVLES